MMDKYYIVALVIVICILLVLYTQVGTAQGARGLTLKKLVEKEFPQYKVIQRQESIVICKDQQSTVLDELVVLRIDPNQQKNIRNFGRRVTITYAKKPSIGQIKKDVIPYLD